MYMLYMYIYIHVLQVLYYSSIFVSALETEKYAHVTFFFNGGREQAWPGEERVTVPSPHVDTYDLQPEMNASGVAKEVWPSRVVTSYKSSVITCPFMASYNVNPI